jgi:hypothetical protein
MSWVWLESRSGERGGEVMGTTTSDTTYVVSEDGEYITRMRVTLWERKQRQLKQAMELLDRLGWFLNWLPTVEPNVSQYIYAEWSRSDPPNTGTRYRALRDEISPLFEEGVTKTT